MMAPSLQPAAARRLPARGGEVFPPAASSPSPPAFPGKPSPSTHADGDYGNPGALTIDATALPGGITVSGNNAPGILCGRRKILTLRGLTLTGGNGDGASGSGDGGAIYNDGVLNLFRCTLRGTARHRSARAPVARI